MFCRCFERKLGRFLALAISSSLRSILPLLRCYYCCFNETGGTQRFLARREKLFLCCLHIFCHRFERTQKVSWYWLSIFPPYSGLFYCIFYGCCCKRNPNDSFQSANVRPLASWHNLTAMFCGILWRCLSVLLSYIQSALLSGLIFLSPSRRENPRNEVRKFLLARTHFRVNVYHILRGMF